MSSGMTSRLPQAAEEMGGVSEGHSPSPCSLNIMLQDTEHIL